MLRSQIITEARSWVGTRFKHQGRVKKSGNSKGGCDCIGLIVGVGRNLNIKCNDQPIEFFDNLSYSKFPDGQGLKRVLDLCLIPIDVESAKPADILLMRISKEPQHVAFIGDKNGRSLIHSYIQARGVVEHSLDEYWQQKIVMAYSLLKDF